VLTLERLTLIEEWHLTAVQQQESLLEKRLSKQQQKALLSFKKQL
jgi:hypothetical protein